MSMEFSLRELIEEAVQTRGAPSEEAAKEELLAAGQLAAARTFGVDAPVSVAIGAGLLSSTLEFFFDQVLRVVAFAVDHRREVSLAALQETDFADVEVGAELVVPIFYTDAVEDRAEAEDLHRQLGKALALPTHSSELSKNLAEEVRAVAARWFPTLREA